MSGRFDAFKALISSGVVALFVLAWFYGEHPPHPSAQVVRPAALLSGAFWLVGALIPVWRQTATNSPGVMNGVAAAFAVYAGLAALHP